MAHKLIVNRMKNRNQQQYMYIQHTIEYRLHKYTYRIYSKSIFLLIATKDFSIDYDFLRDSTHLVKHSILSTSLLTRVYKQQQQRLQKLSKTFPSRSFIFR